jgi:electron transport complex protein RnfG
MIDNPNNGKSKLWSALLSLTAFAALAGLAVSYTAESTRDRIQANRLAHAMRIVAEVLPTEGYDNKPHQDIVMLTGADWLGSSNALPAYRARMSDTPVATAITTLAPDGYVGAITLLVGIGADGSIVAVRALEHRETPGLGDKIDLSKSDWISQFDQLQLTGTNWKLRRDGGDIDHISGATITSRAVLNAVHRTLKLQQNHAQSINAASAGSELALTEPGGSR